VSEEPPSLAEALGWTGFELDDAGGKAVGRVKGVYVDADSGGPVWLVVATGRRRNAKAIAVPLRECAAMPGRIWIAQRHEAMHGAPSVDPTRPLQREHEVTLCTHYGIGERVGRHAEIASRPTGAVTAQPA
jgi:PRC-barrel domain